MKYYIVLWRSCGDKEEYSQIFFHAEEDYVDNFIRNLQERLNVDYIEKVTHETIPC